MERKEQLTDEQQVAVSRRGGNLLVSAAAGSGKTFVLVERLLRRITEPGAEENVDDFLIITYTNAAAAELRGKIREAIGKRLLENPSDRRLRRQQLLCSRAQIGTIHAFCNTLLRENAALVQLSPDFRVADESECQLLRQKTAEELMEDCYEKMQPEFAALLDTLGGIRDDEPLLQLLLTTYERLQSHPDPAAWCEEFIEELSRQDVLDLGETRWGRDLMEDAARRCDYLVASLDRILEDCEVDPILEKAYGASLRVSREALLAFRASLSQTWDAAQALAVIPFPRANRLPKEGYEDVRAQRERVKDAARELSQIFKAPSAPLLRDMAAAAPAVKALLRLALAFGERYRANKRKRGIIDFSDQEHLTLELLRDETGARSPLAEEVSRRFTEIMVDEYQDVNPVQETILRLLSRREGNLFLVGDVKQSIYRFRLADPGIFLEKYRDYPPADEAGEGEDAKTVLSRNFRSREEILETVNFVFQNLMSTELGEMDYTPAEYLYPGKSFPPSAEPAVELDLLVMPEKGEDEEESPDRLRLEADHVARRIKELKETLRITEGEGDRPARWSDFAILLRSPAGRAEIYEKALASWGIPMQRDAESSFFEEPEIRFMLSLLSVIDNPRQDIPLISVLRSPVYGFTPNDLADIHARGGQDFYSALVDSAETEERCAAFLRELKTLRSLAPEMSSDRLIWHIYNTTDLLGIYGAMPDGGERRSRLMLLFRYARDFEDSGFQGLFSFITDLRERMERGDSLPVPPSSTGGDGVRYMSVHKSKGLQFPVVFLPDLSHQFNMTDTRRDLLLHRELGPGARVTDFGRRIKYDTVPRMAIARRIRRESLSEELRVLYVAMTRAEEKMVLTASYSHKAGEKLAPAEFLPPDPQMLQEGKSFADWLAPVLLRAGRLCRVRQLPLEPALPEPVAPDAAPSGPSEAPEALQTEIRERLHFRYPYAAAADLPSKLSPTELKGRLQDSEAALEAGEAPRLRGIRRREMGEIRRPDFAAPVALSAAQKGTAFHTVMQLADWKLCMEEGGALAELRRLVSEGALTEKEAAGVDTAAISRFCRSPEGRAAALEEGMRREFKFSVLLPAADFFPGAPEDEILLQGVVDCFFPWGEGLAVLDFKTDRVSGEEAPLRAREYRGQLDAYAAALESITGKKVTHEILYFTRPGLAVYLKGEPLGPSLRSAEDAGPGDETDL